jgi:hypothetical protein
MAVGLTLVALGTWAGVLLAYDTGMNGVAQSAQGCDCHSPTPNDNGVATVQITGPQTVVPGSTNSYTISVTGGPSGTTGGFDLKSSAGTLIQGTGSKILSGELTHSDGTRRSWNFQWQAPAAATTVNWYAVAQATDGGGPNGDSWNWYGGAVNTAFRITVGSVGVEDGALTTVSLTAGPSPFRDVTRIQCTLARAGRAHLEILDLHGRRIVTLASGEVAAGAHPFTWNGSDETGARVASGLYFVRLMSGDRTLTRRLVLAR